MRIAIVPDKCKSCSYHLHVYDVNGIDAGISEYHCENGKSVCIHDNLPRYEFSWCPHKNYIQMVLLLT